MRQYLVFFLLFFVVACSGTEIVLECEQGFMMNGTVCCRDSNNDSVCDVERVVNTIDTPKVQTPVEIQTPVDPVIMKQSLDPRERQAVVETFAQNAISLWQRERWKEFYQLLPSEEKLAISEEDFAILMSIYNFDARVAHDPLYENVRLSLRFNQFKGLSLALDSVTLTGDTASALIDVTFGTRPAGQMTLNFVWENEWRITNPLPENDKETFCDTVGYSGYCYFQLAKAYKEPGYCTKSNKFFIECYQSLGQEIPIDVAVSICAAQETRTLNDDCLKEVTFLTRSALLCDEIAINLNWYECLGIIAGYAGNLQQCTGTIEAINKLTETRYEARCIYGYVRATGDKDSCKLIDGDVEPDLRSSCGGFVVPWYEAT